MADSIGAFVTGDRAVELIFDQFPQELHQELFDRISGLTGDMAATVRSNVPRKTGRLASEVREFVRDTPNKITGVVTFSAEFAKAAALEYGAHGSAKVGSHTMRLGHAWAHVFASPEVVSVPDYSRHLDLTARRFLRESEQQLEARITDELQQAVNQVSAAT